MAVLVARRSLHDAPTFRNGIDAGARGLHNGRATPCNNAAAIVAWALWAGCGANVEPAPLPSEWWRLFDDPALDGHIARALAVNTDIRVALANLEAARATFRQARAAIIPVAGIESGAGPDRADRQPSTSNVPKTSYELGATFAYEVDLFGRLRAATSAAKADTAASAAALDAARVMVAADTAAAYINICGANAAIKLAQAQIATHEQSVALVARRVARGSVSSLELAQSKALLERTRHTLSDGSGSALSLQPSPPCRVKHPPRPTCCESDAPQFQP
ncbi:MAG: TolC family protein [Sphingomonadales bacterium]|nr:TolC family protein [Sphingomonadales bacterium]